MKALQIILLVAIIGVVGLLGVELTSKTDLSKEDCAAIEMTNARFEKLVNVFIMNKENRNIYALAQKKSVICENDKNTPILAKAQKMRIYSLDGYLAVQSAFKTLEGSNPEDKVTMSQENINNLQNALQKYADNMNKIFVSNKAEVVSPLPLKLGEQTYPLSSLQNSPKALWGVAEQLCYTSLAEAERLYGFAITEAIPCDKPMRILPILEVAPKARTVSKNTDFEADVFLSTEHFKHKLQVKASLGTVEYNADSTSAIVKIAAKDISFDEKGLATQKWKASIKVPEMTSYKEFEVEKEFVVKKK
ncbi:MAG: hypothetical protein OHK0038_05730 [Flammeovirgaceae bacterium]